MENHKMLEKLSHLLIDMDGVLWRGDEPLPGLTDFFCLLSHHCIEFMLVTNNSSRTSKYYAQRLNSFGVEISASKIITSAQATASYLAERTDPDTPVYVIGEEGLRQSLIEGGFRLVGGEERPRYVIVGWDRQLSYDKLAQATVHIRAGATFIATNPDRTWPSESSLLPGTGATVAALQAATDVQPILIGKPSPLMLMIAMQRLGATASSTAMLGDRLETDILGGINASLTTILVLSGISTVEEMAASSFQPDIVFDDIAALTNAWSAIDK
jgi:4-nitrophenyl phosphatase